MSKNEANTKFDTRLWLIREQLRQWDPIGLMPGQMGPLDEYDSYAPTLLARLEQSGCSYELAQMLQHIRTQSIGLGAHFDRDLQRAEQIIQSLSECIEWTRQDQTFITHCEIIARQLVDYLLDNDELIEEEEGFDFPLQTSGTRQALFNELSQFFEGPLGDLFAESPGAGDWCDGLLFSSVTCLQDDTLILRGVAWCAESGPSSKQWHVPIEITIIWSESSADDGDLQMVRCRLGEKAYGTFEGHQSWKQKHTDFEWLALCYITK